ncbi:MAG: hypothetical protein IH855_06405, partial [Bacteroidetes bacterium]|nr:hypothetical protein [Bacteroidota bacterium]
MSQADDTMSFVNYTISLMARSTLSKYPQTLVQVDRDGALVQGSGFDPAAILRAMYMNRQPLPAPDGKVTIKNDGTEEITKLSDEKKREAMAAIREAIHNSDESALQQLNKELHQGVPEDLDAQSILDSENP